MALVQEKKPKSKREKGGRRRDIVRWTWLVQKEQNFSVFFNCFVNCSSTPKELGALVFVSVIGRWNWERQFFVLVFGSAPFFWFFFWEESWDDGRNANCNVIFICLF